MKVSPVFSAEREASLVAANLTLLNKSIQVFSPVANKPADFDVSKVVAFACPPYGKSVVVSKPQISGSSSLGKQELIQLVHHKLLLLRRVLYLHIGVSNSMHSGDLMSYRKRGSFLRIIVV